MEYPKLNAILNDRALLDDEKKMWLRIGIYVTNEEVFVASQGISGLKLYDGMSNVTYISAVCGMNIRRSVLAWWQVEKVKPRAQEVTDNTGLSQLENRNNL